MARRDPDRVAQIGLAWKELTRATGVRFSFMNREGGPLKTFVSRR